MDSSVNGGSARKRPVRRPAAVKKRTAPRKVGTAAPKKRRVVRCATGGAVRRRAAPKRRTAVPKKRVAPRRVAPRRAAPRRKLGGGGGKSPSYEALAKVARSLNIPLSADGRKKTKSSLLRAISYRTKSNM